MTTWIEALVGAAAVGSGLMAGLFFVFSNFAMRALGRIPTPGGMSAMPFPTSGRSTSRKTSPFR